MIGWRRQTARLARTLKPEVSDGRTQPVQTGRCSCGRGNGHNRWRVSLKCHFGQSVVPSTLAPQSSVQAIMRENRMCITEVLDAFAGRPVSTTAAPWVLFHGLLGRKGDYPIRNDAGESTAVWTGCCMKRPGSASTRGRALWNAIRRESAFSRAPPAYLPWNLKPTSVNSSTCYWSAASIRI